jgi:hypothetical protein
MEIIWAQFRNEWGPPPPKPGALTWETYLAMRCWLRDRLGRDLTNKFWSTEALVLNAWGHSPLCIALGLRLLHDKDTLPAYEDTDLWGESW